MDNFFKDGVVDRDRCGFRIENNQVAFKQVLDAFKGLRSVEFEEVNKGVEGDFIFEEGDSLKEVAGMGGECWRAAFDRSLRFRWE